MKVIKLVLALLVIAVGVWHLVKGQREVARRNRNESGSFKLQDLLSLAIAVGLIIAVEAGR